MKDIMLFLLVLVFFMMGFRVMDKVDRWIDQLFRVDKKHFL